MTKTNTERRHYFRLRGNTIEVFGRVVHLPASRLARIGLGIAFVIGGVFSFLPVLGIWMLPVGLLILSIDFVIVRRWRRRFAVRWEKRQRRREAMALLAAQQRQKADTVPGAGARPPVR